MREDSAQRRLDKLNHPKGITGTAAVDPKVAHKIERQLGRALIDTALDDMEQADSELSDPCVICEKLCDAGSIVCGNAVCKEEAVKLGLLK